MTTQLNMTTPLIDDPYFNVRAIAKTEQPNLVSYLAMHQCVAEDRVNPEDYEKLSESELGRRVVC